ncbi:hypothetical protein MASR2M44_14040 [Bacteroidota bacterium]
MIFDRIKKELQAAHLNLLGTCSNVPILVIESDDWGAIRMPNSNVYSKLKGKGIPVESSIYCKYDQLESNEDVDLLINILSGIKNENGKNPVITTNFVVANPDFDKIKQADFKEYFYKSIEETYKNTKGSENLIKKVKQAQSEKLIQPQFHGREHVNVPLWLELLKSNNDFLFAFNLGLWGLSKDVFPAMKKSIQATYDSIDDNYAKESIESGLKLFEEIFGFKSKTFIANNYIWSEALNPVLVENEVTHLQGMKYQLLPLEHNESRKKIRRFSGQKNNLGITYGIRNCTFEPTEMGDTVESTMNQISRSFMFKKPAIISTHRVNFSGGLDTKNRDLNLKNFEILLKSIVNRWPDIIFLSSDELINIIK